jgi:hypothetical protein
MSNFNFCPLVWLFCSKSNSNKLEILHCRALRFVYQDFQSSYETLLEKYEHVTLSLQRLRTLALETFKILNGMAPDYLKKLIEIKQITYGLRNEKLLNVPHVKTTKYGLNSFRTLAATTWNGLPNHIRTTENFSTFKTLISKWTGDSCRCAMCRV